MNRPLAISRRHWIGCGLATCGFLAAGGLGLAQATDVPVLEGYTRPGTVTERGRAPGLQSRVISENPGGEKTYAVVFAKGDEVLSGLTEFAVREKLAAGYFTAIGALQSARFGWLSGAQSLPPHSSQGAGGADFAHRQRRPGQRHSTNSRAWRRGISRRPNARRASAGSCRLADLGIIFHRMSHKAHKGTRRRNGSFAF